MKNILISGATGYLGRRLFQKLNDTEFNLIPITRKNSDIKIICTDKFYHSDEESIKQAFVENTIDMVIHLATSYDADIESITSVIESNIVLPTLLLRYSKKYQVPYFLNSDTVLRRQLNPYSMSKSFFNDLLKFYSSSTLRVINVKLEYYYGPNESPNKFIPMLVSKLRERVEFINLTSGEQSRDFVYIDDVVDGFMTLLSNYEKISDNYLDVPIKTGSPVIIRDLVKLIAEKSKNNVTELRFGVLPDRENEIEHLIDDTRLLERFGWKPKYSLEEGINKLI